jgi:hypothetical protein
MLGLLLLHCICWQAVLSDLGMLEGKGAGEATLFTANHMRVADAAAAAAGAGLGFEAFCKFYDTLVMNKARQQLRFKLGLQAEGEQGVALQCNSSSSKTGEGAASRSPKGS